MVTRLAYVIYQKWHALLILTLDIRFTDHGCFCVFIYLPFPWEDGWLDTYRLRVPLHLCNSFYLPLPRRPLPWGMHPFPNHQGELTIYHRQTENLDPCTAMNNDAISYGAKFGRIQVVCRTPHVMEQLCATSLMLMLYLLDCNGAHTQSAASKCVTKQNTNTPNFLCMADQIWQ